jgi:hypothetical protein
MADPVRSLAICETPMTAQTVFLAAVYPSSLSGLKPKYSFSLRYKKHSEMLKLHPF